MKNSLNRVKALVRTYDPARFAAVQSEPRCVCGGFVSIISSDNRTFWGMSLHNGAPLPPPPFYATRAFGR